MNLETELNQFTGTQQYYQHNIGKIKYTDGIKYLAEKAEAYWLIDIVGSYQTSKRKLIPFQIWELKVELESNKAIITMKEDTDSPILIKQKIEYTNFPLTEIKLYLIDGILMLPSEY